jgi:hypothetical protein
MPLEIQGQKPAHAADILASTAGLPEAVYSSQDLYARYLSVCEENGHGHLSLVAFCRELGCSYVPTRTKTGHRAWLITAS